MKTNTVISVFSALFAAGAAVATPAVSNVSFSHDPAERTVIVNYDLSESAIVTVDVKTNGVSIGSTGLQATCGDVNRIVEAGTGKTVCWYAERGWPDRRLEAGTVTVEVKAWATNAPPKYCVVDLTGKNGAPVGSKYYCDDLDVTNRIYKTDYLVFRHIPAKDVIFPMGKWYRYGDNTYPAVRKIAYHRVKLTNDFYMAVYELTAGQFRNIVASQGNTNFIDNASALNSWKICKNADPMAENPVEPISCLRYDHFRGGGGFWPRDAHVSVAGDGSRTVLGRIRATLGLPNLDMPTEAEWEFACRGGTAEDKYDGTDSESASTGIAWSSANAPGETYQKIPVEVGLLEPNAFGLYDMIGNVREWCLDYYTTNTTTTSYYATPVGGAYYETAAASEPNATAPVGPEQDADGVSNSTAALRVARGGSANDGPAGCLSYDRVGTAMNHVDITLWSVPHGYRLVFVP